VQFVAASFEADQLRAGDRVRQCISVLDQIDRIPKSATISLEASWRPRYSGRRLRRTRESSSQLK
jgi:hypothetical protein